MFYVVDIAGILGRCVRHANTLRCTNRATEAGRDLFCPNLQQTNSLLQCKLVYRNGTGEGPASLDFILGKLFTG